MRLSTRRVRACGVGRGGCAHRLRARGGRARRRYSLECALGGKDDDRKKPRRGSTLPAGLLSSIDHSASSAARGPMRAGLQGLSRGGGWIAAPGVGTSLRTMPVMSLDLLQCVKTSTNRSASVQDSIDCSDGLTYTSSPIRPTASHSFLAYFHFLWSCYVSN